METLRKISKVNYRKPKQLYNNDEEFFIDSSVNWMELNKVLTTLKTHQETNLQREKRMKKNGTEYPRTMTNYKGQTISIENGKQKKQTKLEIKKQVVVMAENFPQLLTYPNHI